MDNIFDSTEQDGYAMVSQLNELRDEFLKAKKYFEIELENMKVLHKSELENKENQINILKTTNYDLQRRVSLMECYVKQLETLIDDSEQYSRRHSLRINGIPKKYEEKSVDVLNSLLDEIRKLKININRTEVDRAHRSGREYRDRDGNRQQATLAKFTTWDALNKFFKGRKGSNFYVKADLTKKKENSLTHARDRIRSDPGVRKSVKYVYVDPNCNLMAFTATGRFTRFNSECAFD